MPVRYAVLTVATAAVAVIGYVGYVLYPRFDLPAATGGALLAVAVGAGVASFFSPCSFPLLVSLLGREPGRRALAFAGALAVGATAFLLLLGAGVAAAGTALFEGITFTSTTGIALRASVGTLLVLLGLAQIGLVTVPFDRLDPGVHALLRRQAKLRRRRPAAGYALFGFGYVLAGIG